MSEPRGLKYPHEKVPTGISLLFLFPRKGETKRVFGVSPNLNLIVTIAPQAVTFELVQPDAEGSIVVRLGAREARGVMQILDGGMTRRFHVVEKIPSKWGRFFGRKPETATMVSDTVYVRTRKDGQRSVAGPGGWWSSPLPRGWEPPFTQSIRLTHVEEANLVQLLSKLLGPEAP
jgi:hypothetical protein